MNFKTAKKYVDELVRIVVCTLIILAVIYIIKMLFGKELPLTNRDAIMLVIGNVLAWGTQIVNYHYGTSHSSAQKNEMLANSTPNKVE